MEQVNTTTNVRRAIRRVSVSAPIGLGVANPAASRPPNGLSLDDRRSEGGSGGSGQEGVGGREYEDEHESGHESENDSQADEEEDEEKEQCVAACASCIPSIRRESPGLLAGADGGAGVGTLSHEVDDGEGELDKFEEKGSTTDTGESAHYFYRSTTGRWLLAATRADVNAGGCQVRSSRTPFLPTTPGTKWEYIRAIGPFLIGKQCAASSRFPCLRLNTSDTTAG